MTVRPANPGESLPELVILARQLIIEEAEALRAALLDLSGTPQPGCAHEMDAKAWSKDSTPQSAGRSRLLRFTRDQAQLICVNAYDHLLTMGRALGSDGAMSAFAHSSLSRVVCEAAVRFAWIFDADIGCEERIMRGAVALLVSVEERLRGVRSIPSGHFGAWNLQPLIDNCTSELEWLQGLIMDAGLTITRSKDGKKIARLGLAVPRVSVPVRLDVTALMTVLLPDSPTWYNISSGVAHSYFWGLRDAVTFTGRDPLAMAPNLLQVAAAAECAISASGLIISRCAAHYGHDPRSYRQPSIDRRARLDQQMIRIATLPPTAS